MALQERYISNLFYKSNLCGKKEEHCWRNRLTVVCFVEVSCRLCLKSLIELRQMNVFLWRLITLTSALAFVLVNSPPNTFYAQVFSNSGIVNEQLSNEWQMYPLHTEQRQSRPFVSCLRAHKQYCVTTAGWSRGRSAMDTIMQKLSINLLVPFIAIVTERINNLTGTLSNHCSHWEKLEAEMKVNSHFVVNLRSKGGFMWTNGEGHIIVLSTHGAHNPRVLAQVPSFNLTYFFSVCPPKPKACNKAWSPVQNLSYKIKVKWF